MHWQFSDIPANSCGLDRSWHKIAIFHQNSSHSGNRACSRPGELEPVANWPYVSTDLTNEQWRKAAMCCLPDYKQSKIKLCISWCLAGSTALLFFCSQVRFYNRDKNEMQSRLRQDQDLQKMVLTPRPLSRTTTLAWRITFWDRK